MLKSTVEIKVGDVYLCNVHVIKDQFVSLKECEVVDICKSGNAVKLCSGEWKDVAEFHKTIKGLLGRYEKKKFLFFFTKKYFKRY